MKSPIFRSYAQNMEDIRLWRACRHLDQGRYIDIGAWDPRRDSISRGFYERGWRGVHFEPHPLFAARLRADRPDETVHELALSDQQGTLRFFLVAHDGTSSGIAELAQTAAQQDKPLQEIAVPMTTLAHACADLAGSAVHWMKIDVEGMEAQVLRGWDASALRPWILVIEATLPQSRIQTQHTFEPILTAADYIPAGFDGLNRYYVSSEHRELADIVAEPVSVFDLMEGCQLSESSAFVEYAVHNLQARLQGLESSWSWRITRPLRALDGLLHRASRNLRPPAGDSGGVADKGNA